MCKHADNGINWSNANCCAVLYKCQDYHVQWCSHLSCIAKHGSQIAQDGMIHRLALKWCKQFSRLSATSQDVTWCHFVTKQSFLVWNVVFSCTSHQPRRTVIFSTMTRYQKQDDNKDLPQTEVWGQDYKMLMVTSVSSVFLLSSAWRQEYTMLMDDKSLGSWVLSSPQPGDKTGWVTNLVLWFISPHLG